MNNIYPLQDLIEMLERLRNEGRRVVSSREMEYELTHKILPKMGLDKVGVVEPGRVR